MPLERRDEAEELGVRWRAVVWRLCGGVRGRAAWRVTSAVPGVVRKADIQFQPAPWVVPRRLAGVSVDFPPEGQSQLKAVPPGQSQLKRRLRPADVGCSLSSAAHNFSLQLAETHTPSVRPGPSGPGLAAPFPHAEATRTLPPKHAVAASHAPPPPLHSRAASAAARSEPGSAI